MKDKQTNKAPEYPRPGDEEAEAALQQQRLDAMRAQQRRMRGGAGG